jgi:hypothetical protein
VRAQVDRDLTTVSWVDRQLGLIKNLGRHNWVEWSYLHDVMSALGFPVGWCNLVMKCVTSVSF